MCIIYIYIVQSTYKLHKTSFYRELINTLVCLYITCNIIHFVNDFVPGL